MMCHAQSTPEVRRQINEMAFHTLLLFSRTSDTEKSIVLTCEQLAINISVSSFDV